MSVAVKIDEQRGRGPQEPRAHAVFLAEHLRLILVLNELHAAVRRRDPWQFAFALTDLTFADADAVRGKEILDSVHRRHTENWVCPDCHELSPMTFDYCWQCDSLHPELRCEGDAAAPELCASVGFA